VLLSRPLHSDSSLNHGEGEVESLDARSLEWASERGQRDNIATAIATPYNQAHSSSSSLPSSPFPSCTGQPVHAEHSINSAPSRDSYLATLDAAVTITSSTVERDCVASRIDTHAEGDVDMDMDMDYAEGVGEGEREQGDISIVVAEQWTACVHCTTDNPPHAVRCEVCLGALSDAGRGS
jgi:hypothetical protein